jgi:hypothetical protein
MTKRLTVALLCVAASALAFSGVAQAQTKLLPYKTAKVLAKRLAEKQVRGRDVISFHLGKARRVAANQIVFPYDDRTRGNVFCVARIVVSSTTEGRFTNYRARFRGSRCAGIPSEVREFEAITRRAQRDLRANTAATVDAVEAVGRSARRCRSVRVPRSARRDAQALFDIALVEALERPNDTAVGNFVAALVAVDADNATLAAGANGWADYLATIRALPSVTSPCAALRTWADNGFSAATEPIDFAAYRALDRRAAADRRAINRAAQFMASRGAFPNAALGFTPDGLLLQLGAEAGITGGQQKASAKAVLG